MSDKEEAKKEEGDAVAKPKKSKKKLFIILGLVLLLAGGGAGAFMMMGKKAPAGGEEATEGQHHEETMQLATIKLEPFIVNLSESSSFLKVTLLLEYNPAAFVPEGEHGEHGGGGGEKKGEGPATPPAFASREPMIRDSIIKVLSSKKAEEVLTVEGKVKLKEDLIESINESLAISEPAIINIYFTEFIIQ